MFDSIPEWLITTGQIVGCIYLTLCVLSLVLRGARWVANCTAAWCKEQGTSPNVSAPISLAIGIAVFIVVGGLAGLGTFFLVLGFGVGWVCLGSLVVHLALMGLWMWVNNPAIQAHHAEYQARISRLAAELSDLEEAGATEELGRIREEMGNLKEHGHRAQLDRLEDMLFDAKLEKLVQSAKAAEPSTKEIPSK